MEEGIEQIVSITEVEDIKWDEYPIPLEGYRIATTQHVYHILIENEESCCETWGYLASENNPQDFIGAHLRTVNLTDDARDHHALEEIALGRGRSRYATRTNKPNDVEYCVQFVDFVTDHGVLQIVVYNSNGNYGHTIIVAQDLEILLEKFL